MSKEKPMNGEDRGCGVFMFGAMSAMLGTGIGWAFGLGLLAGIGWGLIGCVAGLVAGVVVYYVWLE